MVALIGFMVILAVTTQLAGPLGVAGGFLLGAVNALLVGAVLSLIEQSISYGRTLTLQDVLDSFGRYFWDVIGVGFVLWLPLLALEMGTQTNPYGPFFSYAVLLLLFLLLNPAPEVIYQVHHDSPLDVMKTSYEFVLENWMEWFLPIAVLLLPIVLSPAGVREVFSLSSRAGRGAGLDFSASRASVHDPGRMARLSRDALGDELVSDVATDAPCGGRYVALSWPPFCFIIRLLPSSTAFRFPALPGRVSFTGIGTASRRGAALLSGDRASSSRSRQGPSFSILP